MAWYAVRVAGAELKAARLLAESGVPHFNPTRIKHWRDVRTQKWRSQVYSLIPRYQFARIETLGDYYRVLDCEGVVGVLGSWFGGVSTTGRIPEAWVEELRAAGPLIEGRKLPFRKNDRVRMVAGALANYVGVIEGEQGKHAFRVGVGGLTVTVQAVDMERIPQ